jgi:hypothetical protein
MKIPEIFKKKNYDTLSSLFSKVNMPRCPHILVILLYGCIPAVNAP